MRSLVAAVERLDPLTVAGRVAAVNGLLIEARGGLTRLAVGARAEIVRYGEKPLSAEVVGFRDTRALLRRRDRRSARGRPRRERLARCRGRCLAHRR